MGFTRALRAVSGGLLAGAILLGSGGVAAADQVRSAQWPLEEFGAKDIWKTSTGKGVTVAVIDTGFLATHQDIKGSMLSGKTFGDGSKNGDYQREPGLNVRE